MWLIVASGLALAGYGDPVDGYPHPWERSLHVWTNAVRVDPEAFESYYNQGGCSFYEDFSELEQMPTKPVMWHLGLNEVARLHSQDMYDNNFFSHTSSDGTSFGERVQPFYGAPSVSENIAMGYPDALSAVATGWMCSTEGHRGNIMSPSWVELGVGIVAKYYTQDFGMRGVERQALAMGVHHPINPSHNVEFYVDFYDEQGRSPDELGVVLNGEFIPMSLRWGEQQRGMYHLFTDFDTELDCFEYYFSASVDGLESRFPEEGSYGFWDCEYDDEGAMWLAGQGKRKRGWRSTGVLGDRFELGGCGGEEEGCQHSGGATLGWVFVALLAGFRRKEHRAVS